MRVLGDGEVLFTPSTVTATLAIDRPAVADALRAVSDVARVRGRHVAVRVDGGAITGLKFHDGAARSS